MRKGSGVQMGDGFNNGLGLDEGPRVGTDDSPALTHGLVEKVDKGSEDGTGLVTGSGVWTDCGARLAKGLAELEKRRFEVDALQAEINEGAAGRRRGREGKRTITRQAGRRPGRRATTQVGDRQSTPGLAGREAGKRA